MIGLSGLIDTLLTAKALPRLDVLAIKGEAEIGAPGPVLGVGKVGNDVRLPSNAALDRLIAAGAPGTPHPEGAPRSVQAELSVTARLISALLADLHGDAGPVRGPAPAWPSAQRPSAAAVAGALSQTVAESGLFYESHLAEFAAGSRTLAQIAREPQAQWPGAMPTSTTTSTSTAPAAGAWSDVSQQTVASTGTSVDTILQDASSRQSPADSARPMHADAKPPAAPHLPSDHAAVAEADAAHPDVARVQAAYRWSEAAPIIDRDATPTAKAAEATASRHVAAASIASSPAAAEMIHPQAVTLVHQQLDLLATSVFRWNGQAWPGVPMDWSVHQQTEERADRGYNEGRGAGEEEAPRPWSTTVALDLPRLGAVDLRLSLSGDSVQARLKARDASTVERMRADGGELSRRMKTAGLRLQELHVEAMEPQP